MASAPPIRLLIDPPLEGAENMGRDEALLEGVGRYDTPPTLRLYRWNQPTISLGYFQPYDEFRRLPPPAGRLPVVRRPTGGGAILHDLELTYSLTLPAGDPLLALSPGALYRKMHEVIAEALRVLGIEPRRRGDCRGDSVRTGPFFCFARQHCDDLVLGERKLAGSAQRRTHAGVLQHGSVVVALRYPQQPAAVLTEGDPEPIIAALIEQIPRVAARRWERPLCRDEWTPRELELAGPLIAKHRSREWLERR